MSDLQWRLNLIHRLHHDPGPLVTACPACLEGRLTVPAWPERDNRAHALDASQHLNPVQVYCSTCGWELQLVYSVQRDLAVAESSRHRR